MVENVASQPQEQTSERDCDGHCVMSSEVETSAVSLHLHKDFSTSREMRTRDRTRGNFDVAQEGTCE